VLRLKVVPSGINDVVVVIQKILESSRPVKAGHQIGLFLASILQFE